MKEYKTIEEYISLCPKEIRQRLEKFRQAIAESAPKAVEAISYGMPTFKLNGKNLVLYVGYSHPVTVEPPSGISFDVDVRTRQIKVMGANKESVGQIAANIRMVRPPEPYKGKGIKYLDEKIRRKAGKAGKV